MFENISEKSYTITKQVENDKCPISVIYNWQMDERVDGWEEM